MNDMDKILMLVGLSADAATHEIVRFFHKVSKEVFMQTWK